MVVYKEAPEVKEIADELIPKYHQHIVDFNVRVDYLFIDKVPMKGDKEVWGTCRKITNLNAYLAADKQSGGDPFFVITISEPIWDVLPQEARTILVDHQLCHCSAEYEAKDEEEPVLKLSCKSHDMEEFACITRRYGMWQDKANQLVADLKNKEIEEEIF